MSSAKKKILSIEQKIIRLKSKFDESLIGRAINRFGQERGPIFAAGLAFFAFFAIFPLILLIVSIASMFLNRYFEMVDILEFIFSNVPIFQEFVRNNVVQVLDKRGTIGIVGLISLFWSSSSYFHILARSFDMAWKDAQDRSFVRNRMVAFGMLSGTAFMLIIAFILSLGSDLLSHFEVPLFGSISLYETFLWKLVAKYAPFILSLLIFWLLYFITPNLKVSKISAMWGAVFSAIAWNTLNMVFKWYIRSGWLQYELVYGSLSTIVTFLFWIYLTNWIILFGAYFAASIKDPDKFFRIMKPGWLWLKNKFGNRKRKRANISSSETENSLAEKKQ